MPLEPGAQLGPYEVLTPLGAGRMGEAYRAKEHGTFQPMALEPLEAKEADARSDIYHSGS